MLRLSGGPAVLQAWRYGDLLAGFGDAVVLRVWASAVQRLANGSGGLVMKAAPAVTVGLITGVSGSGGLDWSLGSVNVDGWVTGSGGRAQQYF